MGSHHIKQEFNEDKSSQNIQHKKFNLIYPKNTVSLNTTEMSELNSKILENLESLDGGHFRCKICGKDSTGQIRTRTMADRKANMKNHVETHIEGLSYPCQLCRKEFRYKIHYLFTNPLFIKINK